MRGEVAALAGVSADDVALSVMAGSVVVSARISVADAAAATATVSSLGARLSDASVASALLGVTVEGTPSLEAVVEQRMVLAPSSPPPSHDASSALVIGVAAGTAAALLLSLCVARVTCWCRRRGRHEGATPAGASSPKMLSDADDSQSQHTRI